MKKILILLTVLFLGFFAVACGGGSEEDGGDDNLSVALVLTGAINDKGWNQKGYEGLEAIEAEYGADTAYNENTQAAQYNQIIRSYAKDGYDVIIAHGTQLTDAVNEVAAEYPDIKFIITSSDRTAKIGNGSNVAGVLADGVEQGFLMGVAAGYIAQEQGSTKVAAVGGVEIPAIKTTIDGATAGAKYVDEAIEVLSAYTGSFDDINKLKEQSISFIQQGATVIMSTANAATKGAFEAVKDQSGIAIGANSSGLFETYPDQLAASGNVDMSKALLLILGEIVDDNFEGTDYIYGVKEDVVTISFSTTESNVQGIQDKVEDVQAKIVSGEIVVQDLL